MTSLFFSGGLKPGSVLRAFCEERKISLTACSLLGFKSVPFEIKYNFDVVFISSPRSFNYFKSQVRNFNSLSYAAIGTSTARSINESNSSISFTGEKSGDPESVALEFQKWLGKRRVLFPLSTRSRETVAKLIPGEQKEIVYCYETELLPIALHAHDVYVFTSPSNVEAFLQKNETHPAATVIAWGKTTAKKLVEIGWAPRFILETASEEELVKCLETLNK